MYYADIPLSKITDCACMSKQFIPTYFILTLASGDRSFRMKSTSFFELGLIVDRSQTYPYMLSADAVVDGTHDLPLTGRTL